MTTDSRHGRTVITCDARWLTVKISWRPTRKLTCFHIYSFVWCSLYDMRSMPMEFSKSLDSILQIRLQWPALTVDLESPNFTPLSETIKFTIVQDTTSHSYFRQATNCNGTPHKGGPACKESNNSTTFDAKSPTINDIHNVCSDFQVEWRSVLPIPALSGIRGLCNAISRAIIESVWLVFESKKKSKT